MTHNDRKFLYESIMNDIARIVKKRLNEASRSSLSQKLDKVRELVSVMIDEGRFDIKHQGDILVPIDDVPASIQIYDEEENRTYDIDIIVDGLYCHSDMDLSFSYYEEDSHNEGENHFNSLDAGSQEQILDCAIKELIKMVKENYINEV